MELKHSGLGIASFITSIICSVLLFVFFVIAGVMEMSTPGGIDEESTPAVILGMGIIFCVMGELAAVGLGIAAVCQNDRKKIFGILGLSFAAAIALFTLLLLALGS